MSEVITLMPDLVCHFHSQVLALAPLTKHKGEKKPDDYSEGRKADGRRLGQQ